MQVATYFFFWHNCPVQSCAPERVYAVPPGWREPLSGDADPRDGLYYSSRNQYWYLRELEDMRLAGIDVVLPVSWGENPQSWFRTDVLAGLVETNRQLGNPLRIGLFDDTSSEVREYRDLADNQRFDGSNYSGQGVPLDLSDPVAGYLFYDRKIRPFFQTIPQEMWATHNGRSLEEGGRPLIVVYTTQDIVHLDRAGALWQGIKDTFARDFRDRNGRPITPWLILEISWFTDESLRARPSLRDVADGKYVWGSALAGLQVRDWNDYTVTSIGPGFDDSNYRYPQAGRVQPRHQDPDGGTGDAGTFLRWGLNQVPPRTDLLIIETWNELYEGTNVCRAAYPQIAGRFVPEDFYLDLLRRELRGQGLWRAAQPLPPSWPDPLAQERTYRLPLLVENVGTRTWSAESGDRLLLGGDLFPAGQQVPPAGPVRPGDVARFSVEVTTPKQEGFYSFHWRMVGPEGPFGPEVSWTVAVAGQPLSTTLQVRPPRAAPQAGRPFTLSLALDPPLTLTEVHLQVRFDPTLLRLERIEPPSGKVVRWQMSVQNDIGTGRLDAWVDGAMPLKEVARIALLARQGGETGLWVEQVELRLADGTLLRPAALWFPLRLGGAVP